MPLFGPTQLLGPRERQALIESGAYTAEDFGGKTAPPPAPQGPAGDAGPGVPSAAQGDLRPRLLLARAWNCHKLLKINSFLRMHLT